MMFIMLVTLLAAIATKSLAVANSGGVRGAGNHVSKGFESGLEVHVSDGTLCFAS